MPREDRDRDRDRRARRRDRNEGTRAVEGCTDATNELTIGGCRVLSNFFLDLGEAFDTRTRRRDTERRGGVFGTEVLEDVCVSVANSFGEAARTVEVASDRFSDSIRGEPEKPEEKPATASAELDVKTTIVKP